MPDMPGLTTEPQEPISRSLPLATTTPDGRNYDHFEAQPDPFPASIDAKIDAYFASRSTPETPSLQQERSVGI
ncbi:MAG: hypothetical protein ACJ74Z_16555 [Bryobacteraceae bacterium]